MPNTPYPVSGYIYASDGTTLITSGSVLAYNETTMETTAADNIDSSGEYMIDLANLASGAATGDIIFVKAFSSDRRFGYFKFTADATRAKVSNIAVDVCSDVVRLLEAHGENITIRSQSVAVDSNGHTSSTYTDYLVYGLATVISDIELEIKPGGFEVGDLIVFISGNDYNKTYAIIDNIISYDGGTYKIRNVIKEKGIHGGAKWSHFELFCKRTN